jgi:hypothetical protein
VLWNPSEVGSFAGSPSFNVAILDGGPMDGREHPVESETRDLRVIMTDGQQHLYERTNQQQGLPDGRTALVYEWRGRYFGPK